MALGPDILIIPIPPRPPGVAMAAIVELSILTINAMAACGYYSFWGK